MEDFLIYNSQIESIEEIKVHGTAELWTERLILRKGSPEDNEGFSCVTARCAPEDAATQRVLEKSGMQPVHTDPESFTAGEGGCGRMVYEYRQKPRSFFSEGQMVAIEEIPVERIDDFWDIHIRYLVGDGIISDKEDIEYFTGEEYRGILKDHMLRSTDRQHMVYFCRDDVKIGAASYCTYQSEDGKCFILDFWVFPPFRGNGTGHRCFEALERYTQADGAKYYELNSTKEDSVRFWKSIGFTENGKDEYDMPLMIRR